ncbi:MAG: hypothetical protein AcusKO_42520 [Acuticoccus sp.]
MLAIAINREPLHSSADLPSFTFEPEVKLNDILTLKGVAAQIARDDPSDLIGVVLRNPTAEEEVENCIAVLSDIINLGREFTVRRSI